jgi:hypothetical protein
MRTIKQDLELLLEIRRQVTQEMPIDWSNMKEVEEAMNIINLIFENQNKWLLSDKISSEKQARMDQFKTDKEKGMGTPGGEEAPSSKQISYATQLGIEVEGKGYTKKTLSAEIDKVLGKKKPSRDIGK